MYKITRNFKYDFVGQNYSSKYPNVHKYPATMIPQVGIEILSELGVKNCKLLDPYCGSGSSFIAGLDCGLSEMDGFDINPLAVLISRAKFTKINIDEVKYLKQKLRNAVYEFSKNEHNYDKLNIPEFYNMDFWFSKNVLRNLATIKLFIDKIVKDEIKYLFLVPFSETVRECSFTRNHEFKLYKMKDEDLLHFNPDVYGVYFSKLNAVLEIYEKYYYPKLASAKINIDYNVFKIKKDYYDIVLTSPPYGDSKTTVAYGQFSMFSNIWLGIPFARQIDSMLMGGKMTRALYSNGIIFDYIKEISKASYQRALQVSSFYHDLERSIISVGASVKRRGKAIYIVGNRKVKNIKLPTDQFIAEKFEENGFRHLLTYERMLGNKTMPLKNSPTNKTGQRVSTITHEYIIVSEKQ